jgi:hypothetical protein
MDEILRGLLGHIVDIEFTDESGDERGVERWTEFCLPRVSMSARNDSVGLHLQLSLEIDVR